MKVRIRLSKLAAVLLIAGVQAHAQEVQAGEERPDWWQAQRDVVAILMGQGTDIAELVAQVRASPPKTGQEAMFKLSVLLRAGMNQEAKETLRELKELCPNLDHYQVNSLYYAAGDDLSAWEVAQAVVEVFADNISEICLDNRLLKHFLDSGWTVEEVDRWLADRPEGRDHFWVKERLRFNIAHGRGEPLVQELSDNVRRNPQDIGVAIAFLDVLTDALHPGYEKRDLSWMTETVKPQLATEAEAIASRLKTLGHWTETLTFYRKAIEMPLTDEELHRLGMMRQVSVPEATLRAEFAARVREGMAECLLKLGRNDEAQKWMVEAADLREQHHLGRNALFAGQVQAASGQRVIEGRIQEEEKESENDPAYWRERANYYRGREETAQEEEALQKGLALTTPRPPPERPSKEDMDWRTDLLQDYAGFLARMNRTGDAVVLLRQEMEQAPATSMSAERAAYMLAFDFPDQVRVEDEVLWNWLANRPQWGYAEERLLWRMLESAKREDLDKHFSRADELAKGKDPSRAYTLGWIMNRMQFPQRSIPLLRYAVEQAQDQYLKERAAFTLFESYLDTGDWKRAEGIFPEASNHLTAFELSDWYSRVAVVAAKAGAKAEALRIWKAVANVNPAEMRGLDALVKAGLREELAAFYREMQKKMPSSGIPDRALKALEEK